MVLVVMYLYFNVFMFIQSRNVAFQDVTSQSQQLDIDRNIERITISNVTYTPVNSLSGHYNIALTIKNTGPLPVQLVRMWVQNTQAEYTSVGISPPITVPSGGKITRDFSFTMGGTSMDEIVFWFVTARGNLVSANADFGP
jgi:hypothetical protein